jgi:hypothetical protein
MKTISTSIPALSLLAALAIPVSLDAQARPRYIVTDLGPAGNPFSMATWLNNHGLVTGFDTASDGNEGPGMPG